METTIPSFPGTTAVDVSGRLNTFTPTETDGSKAQCHDAYARSVCGWFRAGRADFKAAVPSNQVSNSASLFF